jgi:membrane-bound lytic murein transglycosylase MltF
VNAGLVKVTIADAHIATFWKKIFPKLTLHSDVAVRTGAEIGWMIRKDSPQLKAGLNTFISRFPEGSARRNTLLHKYLKSTKWAKEATSEAEIAKFERLIEFFRKYGDRYDMDYLLMMAQGYQESQLNQEAKSPVGAIGVMQVMPATGAELKVGDITVIEPNIHAGAKYMDQLMTRYFPDAKFDDANRSLFAFASYNAGPGRISQMRKEAEKRGLNPDKWFNNVELVTAEKVGIETTTYVRNIFKYYTAYKLMLDVHEEQKKARERLAPAKS